MPATGQEGRPPRAGHPAYPTTLGAVYLGDSRCRFRVWAPKHDSLELHLFGPPERVLPLSNVGNGYFESIVEDVAPGTQYFYRLPDGRELPDPASRFQPNGVHQPSAVVDPSFPWTDEAWPGRPLPQLVIYELHVGTFTAAGTFDAVIPHLDELVALGVTAIELLPVAQFPGDRNWGYDGVHPFAVQNSYGGPEGLRRVVDACHARRLAVLLDVVYNHLGPEGNYSSEFGHYLTPMHQTPWGQSLSFDDEYCDEVRRFFIESALHWLREYHIDGFRLDAADTIVDQSARPFLRELADAVRLEGWLANRHTVTIAETAINDTRFIKPAELGGFGIDGQWADELHHALHVELTGENDGYYADFTGLAELGKAYSEGYVYTGQYSKYRKRSIGVPAAELPAMRFVVCAQNHDQVGNRMTGDRLSTLVSFEQLKLAAGVVLLAPGIPLLFMGEEYGETNPFQYFVSHSDEALVESVRRGRRREFAAFNWGESPPDPQSSETFARSVLNHEAKREGRGQTLWRFYQTLLRLRRELPALVLLDRDRLLVETSTSPPALIVRREAEVQGVLIVYHFGRGPAAVPVSDIEGAWTRQFDSADSSWDGPGGTLPETWQGADSSLGLAACSFGVFTQNHD